LCSNMAKARAAMKERRIKELKITCTLSEGGSSSKESLYRRKKPMIPYFTRPFEKEIRFCETWDNREMEPLANKIRPKTLKEFIGQDHLVGKGKPLEKAIKDRHLFSFILWGPPGV